MEYFHYSYEEKGYCTILYSGKETRHLQGEDETVFLEEVEKLDLVWEKGNPNTGIFECYEDHLDLLIDPYFN